TLNSGTNGFNTKNFFSYDISITSNLSGIIIGIADETHTKGTETGINEVDFLNYVERIDYLTNITHNPYPFENVDQVWNFVNEQLDGNKDKSEYIAVKDFYVKLDVNVFGAGSKYNLTLNYVDLPDLNPYSFIFICGNRFEETVMDGYEIYGHVPLSDTPLCTVSTDAYTKISVVVYVEGNNPNTVNSAIGYMRSNEDSMNVALSLSPMPQ
ncbi:MAG: hypothetical protein MJ072_04790, partial [Clostridia bacterium]|nr:hypothetical protein [Clostridia bacterium]